MNLTFKGPPTDQAKQSYDLAASQLKREFNAVMRPGPKASLSQPTPADDARISVLFEAADLTGGARNDDYGDVRRGLLCANEIKDVFKKYAGLRPIGPAESEALDRCAVKLARIVTGPRLKRDNYTDLAAYAAIAYEAAEGDAQAI